MQIFELGDQQHCISTTFEKKGCQKSIPVSAEVLRNDVVYSRLRGQVAVMCV
jgi:hypothetical protein